MVSLNNSRKGNLVLQFVVLLIITLIMIFVISAFGVKIFEGFFPSTDSSTTKSFTALYTAMNTKSLSTKNYDSVKLGTYIAKDHGIYFFDNSATGCIRGIVKISRPTACDGKASCLCLLKGPIEHSGTPADTDKYVKVCKDFNQTFSINQDTLSLYNSGCGTSTTNQFYNIIIAHTGEKTMVIMESNESSRKYDDEMKKLTCPTIADSVSPSYICSGKKDGEILTGKEVFDACSEYNKTWNVFVAECKYDTNKYPKRCELNCEKWKFDCETMIPNSDTGCDAYNQGGIVRVNDQDYKYLLEGNLNTDKSYGETSNYFACNLDLEACQISKNGNGCEAKTAADIPSVGTGQSYMKCYEKGQSFDGKADARKAVNIQKIQLSGNSIKDGSCKKINSSESVIITKKNSDVFTNYNVYKCKPGSEVSFETVVENKATYPMKLRAFTKLVQLDDSVPAVRMPASSLGEVTDAEIGQTTILPSTITLTADLGWYYSITPSVIIDGETTPIDSLSSTLDTRFYIEINDK
jgi:energy-coupling factor transporter ATP-binding protein EcfA2